MKKILAGLLLVSGLGCHGTTLIGSNDGSSCDVTLPKAGFYGPNILYAGTDIVGSGDTSSPMTEYEMVVQHDASATVTVNLTLLATAGNGTWNGIWIVGGWANDWHFTSFNGAIGGTQTFEAPSVTGEFEETIYFPGIGQARLDLFECGSTTPSFTRTISWSPPDGGATVLDAAILGDDASSQPPPPADAGPPGPAGLPGG